jgi:hypothetical protein
LEEIDKRENYPNVYLRWSDVDNTKDKNEPVKTPEEISRQKKKEDSAVQDLIYREPPRGAPRHDLRKRKIQISRDLDFQEPADLPKHPSQNYDTYPTPVKPETPDWYGDRPHKYLRDEYGPHPFIPSPYPLNDSMTTEHRIDRFNTDSADAWLDETSHNVYWDLSKAHVGDKVNPRMQPVFPFRRTVIPDRQIHDRFRVFRHIKNPKPVTETQLCEVCRQNRVDSRFKPICESCWEVQTWEHEFNPHREGNMKARRVCVAYLDYAADLVQDEYPNVAYNVDKVTDQIEAEGDMRGWIPILETASGIVEAEFPLASAKIDAVANTLECEDCGFGSNPLRTRRDYGVGKRQRVSNWVKMLEVSR